MMNACLHAQLSPTHFRASGVLLVQPNTHMPTRAQAALAAKAALTNHNAALPLLSLPSEILSALIVHLPLQSLWCLRAVCRVLRAATNDRLRQLRLVWISEAVENRAYLFKKEVYDMSLINGEWTLLGHMEAARRRLGCCAMTDGRVALIGGESHIETHRTCDAMSFTAGGLQFDTLPPLRSKRCALSATNTAAGILVCGGFWQTQSESESEDEESSLGGWGMHSDCWLLRPGAAAWTKCSPLPFGSRYQMASCTLPDGRVFVAGGHTSDFGQREHSNTAAIFSPDSLSWEEMCEMPGRPYSPVACVLPGTPARVLVVDSIYIRGEHFLYSYDLATDAWTRMPGLPLSIQSQPSQPTEWHVWSVYWSQPVVVAGQVLIKGYLSTKGQAASEAAGTAEMRLLLLSTDESRWICLDGTKCPYRQLSCSPVVLP